jgi:Sulfotransferase domain
LSSKLFKLFCRPVSSYPRSGNTWFRKLLAGLYDISYKGISDIDMSKEKSLIEAIPCQVNNEKVFLIKTHGLPFPDWQFPMNVRMRTLTYGFIYLYRHPLDVLLSSLNYLYFKQKQSLFFNNQIKSVEELKNSGELSLYLQAYTKNFSIGKYAFRELCGGTWLNHVNTWQSVHKSHKYLSVMIKYEDMVENTFLALQPIAKMLGKDDGCLEKAIQVASQDTKKDGLFYWKQQSGNYQEYFDKKELDLFFEKYRENFKKLGY